MSYTELKARHRVERDASHPNLSLRVHRALSWLDRAEQSDDDSRFIFFWIAFNAAYATEIDEQYRVSEKKNFEFFFSKLSQLDSHGLLYDLVWSEFTSSIRVLLDNKFVFQPFWDFHNQRIAESEWTSSFAAPKKCC